jgi:hypothetical protein
MKLALSPAHLQRMREVGRKLLRIAGADDSFLDRLTKQQMHAILGMRIEHPYITVQKGASVPRAYVRYIHSSLFAKLGSTYLDNSAGVELSLADAITYGLAFYTGLMIYPVRTFITLGEVEAAQAALDALVASSIFEERLRDQVTQLIIPLLLTISQVQFRLYGVTGGYTRQPSGFTGLTLALHSAVPECITFKHFDRRRKAYRFCMGAINTDKILPAYIRHRDIFPTCSDAEDREYAIYVQQHAILRLKERLHIFTPTQRTLLLYNSLMLSPKIVRGPDEQPLFVAHINAGEVFGYFSFVTQGDKLFVLTFLPITSALTPEGKRLRRMLHLSQKDITYLGMDLLNFLFDIDFDQIPLLKDALVKSGIYQVKEHILTWLVCPEKTKDKQTAFIKKYLEEHPANGPDELLPDDDEPGDNE